jgi:transcriptional accessory protein Tex/SPT6
LYNACAKDPHSAVKAGQIVKVKVLERERSASASR